MRPLLVVVLAGAILGGVQMFLNKEQPPAIAPSLQIEPTVSNKNYDVEVTLTFDAGPDEFALAATDAPSLLLQLNGKPILRRTDGLSASQTPIRIEGVDGIRVGMNEFLVQATPVDGFAHAAIRVQIYRSGVEVADATVWPAASGIVQDIVRLEVAE